MWVKIVNEKATMLSSLPTILQYQFAGRAHTNTTKRDICEYISGYVSTWASENNLSEECKNDVIKLFIESTTYEGMEKDI